MTRLADLTEDELDEDQRTVWDAVTATRGSPTGRTAAGLLNDGGGLIGPFNAWLRSPEVGRRAADLGAALRFGSSLEARLLELVVITVGAHWRSNFEFYAHARLARDAGVADTVVDAIAAGDQPSFARADEATVHRVTTALLRDRRLDDDLYAEAIELLGEHGLVELVALAGYYTIVSFTLNTFAVPVPPGVEPTWPH